MSDITFYFLYKCEECWECFKYLLKSSFIFLDSNAAALCLRFQDTDTNFLKII